MNTQRLTFTREADNRVQAFAIIDVTSLASSEKDALSLLQAAATDWVQKCEAGKNAWAYSGGCLNIGDLAGYISTSGSLSSAFETAGIIVDVVSVNAGEISTSDTTFSYDLILPVIDN